MSSVFLSYGWKNKKWCPAEEMQNNSSPEWSFDFRNPQVKWWTRYEPGNPIINTLSTIFILHLSLHLAGLLPWEAFHFIPVYYMQIGTTVIERNSITALFERKARQYDYKP